MEYKRIRKDRDKFLGISIAEDEKELIAKAAIKCDQSVSDFCRRTLVEVSNDILIEVSK